MTIERKAESSLFLIIVSIIHLVSAIQLQIFFAFQDYRHLDKNHCS